MMYQKQKIKSTKHATSTVAKRGKATRRFGTQPEIRHVPTPIPHVTYISPIPGIM